MIFNKYMLSDLRMKKEARTFRRDPMARITKLINQYHSIDRLDGTEAEKEWAKKRLRGQIFHNTDRLSDRFVNMIDYYLSDRIAWEAFRDGE